MPFTFSHPAAVLPLAFIRRHNLSVTALTVGSMTPDFNYFLPIQPHRLGHSWLGVLWFDLPLGIALLYLYNKVVKEELIDNLPLFLKSRLYRFKSDTKVNYTMNRYFSIVASLLIGITSHLVWDRLNHTGARLVEDPEEFYPLLWDANSVIGALVIGSITWKLPKRDVSKTPSYYFYWLAIASYVVLFVMVRSATVSDLTQLVVAGMSGFFLGLLVTSFVSKYLCRRRADADSC